ncbi:extracellular calcium-sensing receptor-like [Pleurodeles waltl]|uniref:extracellular calcium-sensing receptor-like n=1 Tax=Pleurodeles waltl TaxID=8319 RepID=UPI00370981F9
MSFLHAVHIFILHVLLISTEKLLYFKVLRVVNKDGIILIFRFTVRAFRWVQALVFAVKEINLNTEILPNVTLGFRIHDSCYEDTKAIKVAICLLSGQYDMVPNFHCQSKSVLSVVIGDVYSSTTLSIARILGTYMYPQISHGANLQILSDKVQFPSFMRTMPNSDTASIGIARLLTHFKWSWVGLLSLEKGATQTTLQIIRQDILKAGACIAFSIEIPILHSREKMLRLAEVIKKSSANALVTVCPEPYLVPFMEEMAQHNITGKVWIATHTWSSSSLLSLDRFSNLLTGTLGFAIRRGLIPGLENFLYSLNPMTFPTDPFTRGFWEQVFGCRWESNESRTLPEDIEERAQPCTGSEKLQDLNKSILDVNNFRLTYNVYNAVHAVAHAFHSLISCQPGKGPFRNGMCASVKDFAPWQLLHYLKRVRFRSSDGDDVYFQENGDPPAVFDILNWQRQVDGSILQVKVGTFDYSAPYSPQFILNESAIMWNGGEMQNLLAFFSRRQDASCLFRWLVLLEHSDQVQKTCEARCFLQVPLSVCSQSCPSGYRKATRKGEASCCYDCIQCSDVEISNHSDSAECFSCPDDQIPNERQDSCIPKPIEYLSYHEPLGAILGGISVFGGLLTVCVLVIFVRNNKTPVVKANNLTLSYFLLLSLCLCFLCPFIFIGEPFSVTCRFRQTTFGFLFTLCVSCVMAKTITVIMAFSAIKPDSRVRKWVRFKIPYWIAFICSLLQLLLCVSWIVLSPPFQEQNSQISMRTIVNECNEGSGVAFWLMLGYMGLLAMVTLIVAFLARKLPDTFNETKLITFSMLVFVCVWLSFIPAYLSTRGKHMVAVEIFAILASSLGMFGFIFLPKCFIILLKPERNTKEHIMGKQLD